MTNYSLAFVHQDEVLAEPFCDRFQGLEFRIDRYTHAQPVIDKLVVTPYDLIVTHIRLALFNIEDVMDGKEATDPILWNIFNADEPDYVQAGLRVIQRVREQDSVNKQTPIVAIGLYESRADLHQGEVEQKCFGVGANAYVNLMRATGSNLLEQTAFRLLLLQQFARLAQQ